MSEARKIVSDNVSPLFGQSMRVPPSNVQAEHGLLGALMMRNREYDSVGAFLRADHFADPINGRIYQEIATRIDRGETVDAITLRSAFENAGILEEVGGMGYLAQLIASMASPRMADGYARAVFQAWQRRRLIEVGEEIVNGGFDGSTDISAAMHDAAQSLDAIAAGAGVGRAGMDMDQALDAAEAAIQRAIRSDGMTGLSTGFHAIDDAMGGLETQTLTILGGRPGMGKSALGWQIALAAARHKIPVAVVSLEMAAGQLARRALSIQSGVPIWKMRRGKISTEDGLALVQARADLRGLPIWIDDDSAGTISEIRRRVRYAARRLGGLGLVMVDHLHIVRPEGTDIRAGATYAVGQVSQAMKALAKELNVPVLLLAQLNREADNRDDHRPVKTDLRQAGDIEQDADNILFVYRPEYYVSKGEPEQKQGEKPKMFERRKGDWMTQRDRLKGVAEVIIAKQRDGDEAVVKLHFDGPTASFSEVTDGR